MQWNRLALTDAASQQRALDAFKAVKAKAGRWHLRNNLDWLSHIRAEENLTVYSLEGSDTPEMPETPDTPTAFAVLLQQTRPLPFQIGEVVWYRKKLERLELWAEPVFAASGLSGDQKKSHALQFLRSVRQNLSGIQALSIEGLPTDSYFYDLVMNDPSVSRDYEVLTLGDRFQHQFISLPPTVEEYWGQMGGKTRRNLKYDRRKLEKDFSSIKTVCFETQDSVDAFLDDAIAVSRKTYQWRLLGLGLRDREGLKTTFSFAANKGWLRNYIFYVDDQPVAFMLGYQYDDCYYYTDVGFDPDWAKWSVGSTLQVEVIEDLYSRDDTPSLFDFGTGFGYHKAQFGNTSQEEVNVLLMRATLVNRLMAGLFKLNVGLEKGVVSLVEKLGIKKQLKRFIRAKSG